MLKKILYIKAILTLVFTISVAVSFASFSSTSVIKDKDKDKDKKKDKSEQVSLKNIQRPAAFFSLSSISSNVPGADNSFAAFGRLNFLSTPAVSNTEADNEGVNVNSTIRIKSGNDIVVYPYSYKLKPTPFSLFKTPGGR